MKVLVPTNDKYLWALRPFAYLFNIYWSSLQPVVVLGFNRPQFDLPKNFEFVSLDHRNYGAGEWTNGLLKFLPHWDEDYFVWMLEDYWLVRGVNHGAVASLEEYMRIHPGVLRIDLTSDRLHSGRARDVDTWGSLDIIETPPDTPYQWSTQACVVNRKHMIRCLRPDMAPWDFELRGNELIPEGLRVLGTRQYPVRYLNAIGMQCKTKYRTEHERHGVHSVTIERIPQEHLDEMHRRGLLPENKEL